VNTPAAEFDIFEPENMPATVDVDLELATRPAGHRAWDVLEGRLVRASEAGLPDAVAAAMADLGPAMVLIDPDDPKHRVWEYQVTVRVVGESQ